MLHIRIEGHDLDLEPNNNFDLEMQNSMIAMDAPTASKAMAVVLSDSPRNRDFMRFVAHPQVYNQRRRYQGDVYNHTSMIDSGYFYLRDSLFKYEFDFTSNIKEFFGPYQARLLSEIDLGIVSIPTNWNNTLAPTWYNTEGCVFPTIKNPSYYVSAPGTFVGLINEYGATNYVSTTPFVPMFGLKHIMQKVADLAGVSFAGDFWNDSRTAKLLLYTTREIGTATNIERRLYLPNFTIAQLINGLRKTFNLWLRFDVERKVLRLDYAKTVHNGLCTINWTKYMPPVKAGTLNIAAGIELSWLIDADNQLKADAFYLPYITPTIIDNGQPLKIQSIFMPLQTDAGLPYTKQFGITPEQGDKKYVPALLSWEGLVGGVPLAQNKFGTIDLEWNSLFTAFWSEEEKFRQNGYNINVPVALPAAETARMSAILRGQSSELPIVHANGTNYLIDTLVTPSVITNISQLMAVRT